MVKWLEYLLLGILVEHCSDNLAKSATERAMSFGVLWAEAEKAHGANIAMSDMEDAVKALDSLVERSGNMYSFRLTRQQAA